MGSISQSTSADASAYIPFNEWPTVEAMANGFGEYLMAPSNKLSGTKFTLIVENKVKISHDLSSDTQLTWNVLECSPDAGASGTADYAAYEVRPGFFFIDFYKPSYDEEVSIALNKETGQASVTISGYHMKDGTKRTWTTISDAYVDGSASKDPFPETEELIGQHIMYRYTPRDIYEHVYLNKVTMTWHCLSGTENGVADTERCKMLKLSQDLYLLFWTETIMAVESVIIVDLQGLRSTGRFFCWDEKSNQAVRVRFGSYATILAQTKPAETLKKILASK
jgi:hypothetical protein